MSSTAVPESLYQLTQQLKPSLSSVTVSPEQLQVYVGNLVKLLLDQQIQGKVWLKLPQTRSWLPEIAKYQQQGYVEQIYLCNQPPPDEEVLTAAKTLAKAIPVQLVSNNQLKREAFLVFLSTQFCALILTQWQKGTIQFDSSGKRVRQPHLKLVSSFNPNVIAQVLRGLKTAIAEPAAAEIITEADLELLNHQHSEDWQLISHLLLKQIESTEVVFSTTNKAKVVKSDEASDAEVFCLNQEFFHKLVRELRTPITHMKTALSLLESKQIKGKQRQRYMQMLNEQCDRQNALVTGLLEILQLENYIESEAAVYVSLDELVPGIVSTYQPLAGEKNIQLGYTIPNQLPPVACPVPWLRQIIINLLNNSLQFTPAQGRVFVQASLREEEVELTVSDTGVGIEHKELSQIFNSFYRGKAASSQEIAGAGLGLTIVQQLMQRCGGSISVSSKVSKGSSFRLLFPTLPPELVED